MHSASGKRRRRSNVEPSMTTTTAALFCVALFNPANSSSSRIQVGDAWLIKPGKSIGKVYLGEQQAAVFRQLGNPSPELAHEDDAAMGHFWNAWKAKAGRELNVYTVRGENDSAAHPEQFVRQVRVESPSFHTADGVKVGTPLDSIHRKFSELKLIKPTLRLLDCTQDGIAFELKKDSHNQWRCSAIIIHPKNRGVLEEYNRFRNYD